MSNDVFEARRLRLSYGVKTTVTVREQASEWTTSEDRVSIRRFVARFVLVPRAVSNACLFVGHFSVCHVALVHVKNVHGIEVYICDLVNNNSDLFGKEDITVFEIDVPGKLDEDSHRS